MNTESLDILKFYTDKNPTGTRLVGFLSLWHSCLRYPPVNNIGSHEGLW